MKDKFFKHWKTMFVILILVLISIVSYTNYVERKLSVAENMYRQGDFFIAGTQLDNVIYFGKDKYTFDKIKYAGYIGGSYESYKSNLDNEKYEYALGSLISSVKHCIVEEPKPKSEGQKESFYKFKELYYSELSNVFGISEEEANNIANMELAERDIKIKELSETFVRKKTLEENSKELLAAYRENPIEVKNIRLDNNSDYMIAIGEIYNKSDISIESVEIKVEFKDKDKNVLATTYVDALGAELLEPGETIEWKGYSYYDSSVAYANIVSIDTK